MIRVQIDELHRLKAALLLLREGVDHTRIKVDLDLSDSTFDRYERLPPTSGCSVTSSATRSA